MTVSDPRREIMNRPSGWGQLVDDLVVALTELEIDIEVHQVKEKFGGLRFYVNYPNENWPEYSDASDRAEDLISEAEEKSYKICQACGEPGSLRVRHSWMLTLCDECADEYGAQTLYE